MVFKKLALAVACLAISAAALPSEVADLAPERRLYIPLNPIPDVRYPSPSKDPFYAAPANLSSYKNGDIIREREITQDVTPGIDRPAIGKAYQLLYKTETTLGAPDATVTTVYKPKKVLAGPAKILSLALFVDAALKDCANSWGMIESTNSSQTIASFIQFPIINAALNKGYYITMPDFQGTQAAFTAGVGQGRAQMDGTRAILNHRATISDTRGNQIILAGYSGGAHAAGWASQIHKEYAPELNIRGAALGGIPADLKSIVLHLNKSSFSALALSSLVGLANAYPEFEEWLLENLNQKGRDALKDIRSNGKCVLQESLNYGFTDYLSWVRNGTGALEQEVPKKIIALNRLGARGAKDVITRFPRFIYHTTIDELIPEAPTSQYVLDQCAAGSSIKYSTSLLSEHILESFVGLPQAFDWIVRNFEGTLRQKGCSRSTHSIADLLLPRFEKNVGKKAAEQARGNAKLNFHL